MIAKASRKNTAAFHNVDKELSRGRCLFREFDKTFFYHGAIFFCVGIFFCISLRVFSIRASCFAR
jgi:hypothetical protein